MAIFRPIQISFWQDPYILDLDKDQKYFYLYLLTNSRTTQCGIYQISYKIVSFETGFEEETIKRLIRGFVDDGKVLFNEEHMEIMLLNWYKYNPVNNRNIEKRVLKELKEVKTLEFIDIYVKLLDQQEYEISLIKGAYKGLIRGLQDPNKNKTSTSTSTSTPSKQSSDNDTPATNNDAQEIVDLVTKNINPMLNSFEIQLIAEWLNEHPKELIIEAIKQTALNKATSIKYTDAILRSWKAKNIRTLQELEQYNTRRQTSKSRNYEVSTPDWLKEHEERRRNTNETIEQVSVEDTQKILKQFQ